ncbi:MAG: tRNA uridine-5-carboxymethylaminomethyl(34) synthesis GTPase MnmE [Oscillospiraceae bacterium]
MLDTIAAIATPDGEGGIGIVRISGERAHEIADMVFQSKSGEKLCELSGYTARLGSIKDECGRVIDEAVALVFRAPRSYTGENVAELMCHGGRVVVGEVLKEVLRCGAVPASRGEFTRRAFMSGRISLTEAESVMDVIRAASRQGEAAAAALAGGALYRKTTELKAGILSIQSHIAAYIDFPEEDVEEVDTVRLMGDLKNISQNLERLVQSYELGATLLRGVSTVIVGCPNVGKSTLLNLLTGCDNAIVTPIAGTTRDIVEQSVSLGGTTLLLADTAGIHMSDELVEKIGIGRALERLKNASLVLAVFDRSRELSLDDRDLIEKLKDKNTVAIISKTDLAPVLDCGEIENLFAQTVYISDKEPDAAKKVDLAVRRALRTDSYDTSEPILANERQRSCARTALTAVNDALDAAHSTTLDVVYAILDEALAALSGLSGENVSEAVIDSVFDNFCVGK